MVVLGSNPVPTRRKSAEKESKMNLFACLFLLAGNATWRLDDSGALRAFDPGAVITAPNGDLYLLLRDEALIKRYNAEGALLKTFAGKGEGPGELRMPFRLFFQDDVLYVSDILAAAVSLYRADGTFIERVRLGERKLDAVKVANGWVYGDWNQFQYDADAAARVWWADARFQNALTLFSVKGRGAKGTFSNDGVTSVYSPVSATPRIAVNREGTRVFVADGQGFRIRVIDPLAKKVIREIRREEPTLEFNPDWADVRLNEVKAMMPDIKFKTNYPEYFPIIRGMWIHAEGWLVIDRWTREPATDHDPLVLDERGKEIRPTLSWQALTRWVASSPAWAYVNAYDPKRREMTLIRCPKDKVMEVIDQYPYQEEDEP